MNEKLMLSAVRQHELMEMAEKAAELLEETNEELDRSNQDLARFALTASHDLQEPLRQITGFIELLEKKYQGVLDEEAQEFLGYVSDGARRMQALIRDLLAYARVGKEATAFVEVNLSDVVQRVLKGLQPRIQETGATIQVGDLPIVRGNATLLAQVFQNLIQNALKFNNKSCPEIQVGARLNGSEWVIWVRDNGIGFPSAYTDRVFQMFQRLHPIAKGSGTGIGLAICKKAVQLHGGEMRAESEPGQGATFYFTLPAILK